MNNRATLAICAFAAFLDGYDIQALGLAVPGLAAHLQVAPSAFAAALSLSLAGMAAGAMLLAPLADRFGRQAILVLASVLIGTTTLAAVTSGSPGQLALWRSLTGVGLGALLPLAVIVAAETAAPRRRTFTVTLITSCAAIGSLFAALAAPVLEDALDWRGIFYLGAAMPLVLALLLFAFPPAAPPSAREIGGPSRARASVATLFAKQFRLRTSLLLFIFFVSLLATYSLISWLPSLLNEAGWSRSEAQRAAGFLALGSIFGGLTLAWASDRGRTAPALTGAYILATVSFVGVGLAPASKAMLAGLIFLIGAGSIGSQFVLGSLAAGFYPAEARATGVGWASGIGRLGSILGPLAFAAMMTAQFAAPLIIASLAAPMAVCAVSVFFLSRAINDEST